MTRLDTSRTASRLVGKPVGRLDGHKKVTGTATYAYEHTHIGQALVGMFATATIGRGEVVDISTSIAEAMPGVRRVITHKNGEPKFVQRGRKGVAVTNVRDCWRIDDRWWTEQPVSRMYYELELASGEVITLFHDLIADLWLEHH